MTAITTSRTTAIGPTGSRRSPRSTSYVQQLAYFLEKMEATKDVDGNSLLHNSQIVYGSANADGNRHSHTNLPIILAGGGGGTLNPAATRQQQPRHQSLPEHDGPHRREFRNASAIRPIDLQTYEELDGGRADQAR